MVVEPETTLPGDLADRRPVSGYASDLALFCRVGRRLCALPSAHLEEVMRPLPIDPVPGAPSFAPGVSIIRGAPIPVVDLAFLIDEGRSEPAYFVVISLAGRRIALTVDSVLGVRLMSDQSLQAFPPLLENAKPDMVSAMAALDDELLFVLNGALSIPEGFGTDLDPQDSAR